MPEIFMAKRANEAQNLHSRAVSTSQADLSARKGRALPPRPIWAARPRAQQKVRAAKQNALKIDGGAACRAAVAPTFFLWYTEGDFNETSRKEIHCMILLPGKG
jgi:hypothetical protein